MSTSDPLAQKDTTAADKPNSTAPDSSGDNCHQPEQSADAKVPDNGGGDACNGEVTDSKQVDVEESNITSSNGSATPKGGKATGEFC